MILRGELDFAGCLEAPLGLFLHGLLPQFSVCLIFVRFVAAIEADRRLQNQEYIVPGSFDFADRLRDPVGIR